jgi:hypothetical protein
VGNDISNLQVAGGLTPVSLATYQLQRKVVRNTEATTTPRNDGLTISLYFSFSKYLLKNSQILKPLKVNYGANRTPLKSYHPGRDTQYLPSSLRSQTACNWISQNVGAQQ